VHDASVPVQALGTIKSLTDGLQHRADAQRNQHQRDTKLEHFGERRRHLLPQYDQQRANDNERQRMPEPPVSAEHRGADTASLAADERRHGGEMIGFERVPNAEQRSKARTDQEIQFRSPVFRGCGS